MTDMATPIPEARESDLRESFTAKQREMLELRWKLFEADKKQSFHQWIVGFVASNRLLFDCKPDDVVDMARNDLNQESAQPGTIPKT